MQDTNVWWNAVPLDDILKELEKGAPKAANIVVFDACRNELLVPEKNGVKGFEPIAEKKGLLIAFATSPNTSASDQGVGGGYYARALSTELVKPGQDQMHLFHNVRRRVFSASGNNQWPWDSNGLLEAIYLAGTPEQQGLADQAKLIWGIVKDSSDVAVLKAFALQFGSSEYGPLAQTRIAEIEKSSTVTVERMTNSSFGTPSAVTVERMTNAGFGRPYPSGSSAPKDASNAAAPPSGTVKYAPGTSSFFGEAAASLAPKDTRNAAPASKVPVKRGSYGDAWGVK
jgi:hypothetical protein